MKLYAHNNHHLQSTYYAQVPHQALHVFTQWSSQQPPKAGCAHRGGDEVSPSGMQWRHAMDVALPGSQVVLLWPQREYLHCGNW